MSIRLLAIGSLVFPALLTAQTERISVRMAPVPNQTVRMRTVQETNMTMEPDAAAPGGTTVLPAMNLSMTMTLEHTATVGPTDGQGRYQARTVIDNANVVMTMNGKPMSPPQPAMSQVVGQVVTFVYDDQGKVVDVTMEGGLVAQAAEAIKGLLKSAIAGAPPMLLAVGESATTPAQMSMPLPMGAGDMKMTGETTYTLKSITYEGSERIAHLVMKMTNAMNQLTPAGTNGPTLAMNMTMTSEGTTDVNIDRGIVVRTEQTVTIDGTTRFDSSSNSGVPAMPAMRMHGTTKISGGVY